MVIQQKFYHSLSNVGFNSEEEAKSDYEVIAKANKIAAEKNARLQERRNYVRLNAKCVSDIPQLIIDSAKDLFDVRIAFHQWDLSPNPRVCNSHAQLIGEPYPKHNEYQYYPGLKGYIRGKIFDIKTGKESRTVGLSSIFGCFARDKSIVGFHTGSGSGGDNFRYGFYFFLQDFPHLYKKYQEYKKLFEEHSLISKIKKEEYTKWIGNKNDAYNAHPDVIQNRVEISRLTARIAELNQANSAISNMLEIADPFQFKSNFDNDRYSELKADLAIK